METIEDQVKAFVISSGGSPQKRESSGVLRALDDQMAGAALVESTSRVDARKMSFMMAAVLLLFVAITVIFGIIGVMLAQSMHQ